MFPTVFLSQTLNFLNIDIPFITNLFLRHLQILYKLKCIDLSGLSFDNLVLTVFDMDAQLLHFVMWGHLHWLYFRLESKYVRFQGSVFDLQFDYVLLQIQKQFRRSIHFIIFKKVKHFTSRLCTIKNYWWIWWKASIETLKKDHPFSNAQIVIIVSNII